MLRPIIMYTERGLTNASSFVIAEEIQQKLRKFMDISTSPAVEGPTIKEEEDEVSQT